MHTHTAQGHARLTPQHQHLSRSKAARHLHTHQRLNDHSPLKVRQSHEVNMNMTSAEWHFDECICLASEQEIIVG